MTIAPPPPKKRAKAEVTGLSCTVTMLWKVTREKVTCPIHQTKNSLRAITLYQSGIYRLVYFSFILCSSRRLMKAKQGDIYELLMT